MACFNSLGRLINELYSMMSSEDADALRAELSVVGQMTDQFSYSDQVIPAGFIDIEDRVFDILVRAKNNVSVAYADKFNAIMNSIKEEVFRDY